MRKPVSRDVDEDLEDHFLEAALYCLHEGVRGSGTTLTPDECAALLKNLGRRPPPTHTRFRLWLAIALHSHLKQPGGVEAAVAATMAKYGVSRATVYAARRQHVEYERLFNERLSTPMHMPLPLERSKKSH